jgi:hypothetical protein
LFLAVGSGPSSGGAGSSNQFSGSLAQALELRGGVSRWLSRCGETTKDLLLHENGKFRFGDAELFKSSLTCLVHRDRDRQFLSPKYPTRTIPAIAAAERDAKRTDTVARGPVPCRSFTVPLPGLSTGSLMVIPFYPRHQLRNATAHASFNRSREDWRAVSSDGAGNS